EYGGNLNEAINAHFLEGDRHILSGQGQNLAASPQYNNSGASNQNLGILPFLNAARRFRPSLLLDPNYRRELRDLYNGNVATAFTSRPPPLTSHPAQVREVPVGINSAFRPHYQSGLSTTGADATGDLSSHGLGIRGTDGYWNENTLARSNASHVSDAEIEEAMLQAAIEASKMERRGGSSREQFDVLNDSSDGGLPQSHFQQEDVDLAHAISLSLEDAENPVSPRADKQKELKSLNKVDSHSSKEEESCKKMLEKEESGEMLDKKEVRLCKEPLLYVQIISIVVRMPDGRRLEQRFDIADKVQVLFDFVDIVGFVGQQRPGTYRLVKSYPRRAYSINDCSSTLSEVGLSNDSETLFLEFI
ncbi:Plant UBX domain-containing protein 8, partial [Mucuna pruriens]